MGHVRPSPTSRESQHAEHICAVSVSDRILLAALPFATMRLWLMCLYAVMGQKRRLHQRAPLTYTPRTDFTTVRLVTQVRVCAPRLVH